MFANLFLRSLNYEAGRPGKRSAEILQALALEPGQTVLDFGSGGGYYSMAFARLVGETGTVYAADVKPNYLDFVIRRASEAGLRNITPVRAGSGPLPLPDQSVDLIFTRSVFHEIKDPGQRFAALRSCLRGNGRVVVIDYLPGPLWSPITLFGHVSPLEKISEVMEGAGYAKTESYDFLPGQSFTLWSRNDRS